jgi:LPXTG-motif cell wall-anchored protein
MPTTPHAHPRARIRTWAGVVLATGAATAGLAFATSGAAAALPNCGGNNDVKVAPPTTGTGGGSTTPPSETATTCPLCTTSSPASSGGSALSNRTLPETGSNGPLLIVLSAGLVVVGVVLVTKGRDRGTVTE